MSDISYLDNHREPKLKPMTGSPSDKARVGWAVAGAVAIILGIGVITYGLIGAYSGRPSIAGSTVPDNLKCQEDEVIGFMDSGSIGCVHVDTLWRYGNETDAHPS
jgi:hypothetical protein